ncbi:juvenile hormone esterase-like [Lutzomyia longipalpis]|uniref:juvenile hormone esterase-like n=1 Tax=Lutzomyia longipalpis TaxID=7200 RepID=UPI002483C4F4|nr:juvenile hormone esterase-like [Lutzomyia longipalpis]
MWRDMPLLLILICGQFVLFVNMQNISVNGEEFHSKSYVAPEPIVCVDAGCVRGRVVNGVRNTYEAFYGIPYAEPPVGKLRFKNPIPRGAWTKSWDATYPRSACLQKNYFNYRQPIVGSEDCLYLNVYRPSGKYLKKNLPVLIFIHGGGFLSFSSSPSELGPDYFMATNAVIVVTFNYRLGVFGFLCSGDEAIQGNFGLKDQQLALEWVAGNIGFFGGDENSITLAGQNAGAASVNLHMLNRKSQSLFHRAILMSGSALASPLFPIDSPHQFRMEAMASGITDWDTAPIYKLAEKVKQLDGLKLLHAVDQLFTFPGIPPVPLRPCIEGDWKGAFLTEDPKKIWAEGAFEQKPMLLSLTRNEGIVEAILTTNKTRLEEYNRNIYKLLPIQMGFNPLYTDDVLQFYFGNKKYIDHNNVDRYYQMVSDRFFRYQFFVLISQYLKYADVQKNPIYFYEFAFESSYTFLKYITGKDINLGVGHFDDLIYLFTMPGFFPPFEINTPESRMSGILVRTIVNFVAAGEIKKWRTIKPCTAITTELGCDRQVFKRYRELSPHQVVVSVTNRINGDMLKFWEGIDSSGTR